VIILIFSQEIMKKTYNNKTLSFWKLLKDQNIEIPIIQRDYAQGREDKKEIRENFLSALFNSLKDEKPIKLDFIYGSNENGSFQPLDGQQRLTTLFLLHWYAALKENIPSEDYKSLLNFSYETRISSREFCETLVSNPIIIQEEVEKLSSTIIDSAWFFLSWKKDPTIDAMLRSIDDIHKRFFSIEKLWQKLTLDPGLVTFYHVDLEDIGLTDDLYIKMNARGKLLSPFENFKASFQKFINDNKWDEDKMFPDTFACKIDTQWTDLFWNHRKENSIDEALIRFIATIAMIRISIEKSEERNNIISKLQDDPNSVKIEMFTEKSFTYLCETFDLYQKTLKTKLDLKMEFPLFQHAPDNDLFSAIVYEGQNASYTQKVYFYAQTEYISQCSEFNPIFFQDWMRVVRNILSRGDVTKNGDRPAIIRSPQTFDGVINLIRELSDGCSNIYKYLAYSANLKSTFAKEQIEEEKLKANLIMDDPKLKKSIFATEDTNLLQGRIEFALDCINYDPSKQNFDEDALVAVQKVISNNFSIENTISNDMRRALLTISNDQGEYNYYGYWWSFWNVVSANKRCLIDKYREVEYYIYGNYKNRNEYRIYFKKLINQLIDKSMKEIAQDFNPPSNMPNWKIRLIKEPDLLDDKSKSNYIAIPDDENCCYLLKSMRPRDLDGCERIQ